jgi:hypothetical protein
MILSALSLRLYHSVETRARRYAGQSDQVSLSGIAPTRGCSAARDPGEEGQKLSGPGGVLLLLSRVALEHQSWPSGGPLMQRSGRKAQATLQTSAQRFVCRIMQVSLPWARRRPLPSRSLPSEVAMVPPRWMSTPSQVISPRSGRIGRTKLIFISTVV